MLSESLVARIRATGNFFDRTTDCFDEADSGFVPSTDLYTVAAHVEHVAGSIRHRSRPRTSGRGPDQQGRGSKRR